MKEIKVSNCLPLLLYKGDISNLKFIRKNRTKNKKGNNYFYSDEYIYCDITNNMYYRTIDKIKR